MFTFWLRPRPKSASRVCKSMRRWRTWRKPRHPATLRFRPELSIPPRSWWWSSLSSPCERGAPSCWCGSTWAAMASATKRPMIRSNWRSTSAAVTSGSVYGSLPRYSGCSKMNHVQLFCFFNVFFFFKWNFHFWHCFMNCFNASAFRDSYVQSPMLRFCSWGILVCCCTNLFKFYWLANSANYKIYS